MRLKKRVIARRIVHVFRYIPNAYNKLTLSYFLFVSFRFRICAVRFGEKGSGDGILYNT